jgi:site-specific recombinase XerD
LAHTYRSSLPLDSPDENALKGKRDQAILAVLLGCGLRRRELAQLHASHFAALRGTLDDSGSHRQGGHIRTGNYL